jgi:murein DD-endopeptidase MepM/ murein hydrolase activator NlpD
LVTTIIAVLQPLRLLSICTVDIEVDYFEARQNASHTTNGGEGHQHDDNGDTEQGKGGVRLWSDIVPIHSAPPTFNDLLRSIDLEACCLKPSNNTTAAAAAAAAATTTTTTTATSTLSAAASPLPLIRFPFTCADAPSYLCSQGFAGRFTHFFPQTIFAIDLDCAIGTPIVAVASGIVTQIVVKAKSASGIGISNLFHWNSVSMQTDQGYVVEYVHIDGSSIVVNVGDRVQEGQVICHSGQAGFCPRPHLHLQLHADADPKSPTIAFAFRPPTTTSSAAAASRSSPSSPSSPSPTSISTAASCFIAQAGKWYNADGEANK